MITAALASMRPARKGPENLCLVAVTVCVVDRFNEAGPQGAGKPDELRPRPAARLRASMRPARKGPENLRPRRRREPRERPASMRPARKGPENLLPPGTRVTLPGIASMRPARKGPENRRRAGAPVHRSGRFNEAGPQGAGKPKEHGYTIRNRRYASMRPARKGPENQRRRRRSSSSACAALQ